MLTSSPGPGAGVAVNLAFYARPNRQRDRYYILYTTVVRPPQSGSCRLLENDMKHCISYCIKDAILINSIYSISYVLTGF
ncbi:Uncharacterised protein [Shigella sonnei]|nr:Uncharacterised protein [Shigella sonnei]